MMQTAPERGIVITTAELASEGVDAVLDTIAATGANAITTTSSVVVPATEATGQREPPLDVAGERRVLDRPLWGERVAWIRRYAAHPPDPALWRDVPWGPPPVAPEHLRVDRARAAIDGAHARGMRASVLTVPYTLPGGTGSQETAPADPRHRDAYRPVRFVGGSHPDGIAFTGCLNNPAVRALGRARVCETIRHYPDADGIVVEWVEYPVYFVDKLFTCFCDHCQRAAAAEGFDWEVITAAVRVLWDSLHTLTPDQVEAHTRSGDWGELVTDPDTMLPGFNAWLAFKARSALRAFEDLRQALDDAGGADVPLIANTFAMPWGRMTGGAWLPRETPIASQRVKLYSFHWLMMVRWWTETMLAWNRGSAITPEAMTRGVLALFNMTLEQEPHRLDPADFGMPGPDEAHNLTMAAYVDRVESLVSRAEGEHAIVPLVHAYRPADEFARLLEALRPLSGGGVWVQRYGYLSDAKLAVLREAWTGTT